MVIFMVLKIEMVKESRKGAVPFSQLYSYICMHSSSNNEIDGRILSQSNLYCGWHYFGCCFFLRTIC